MFVFQLHRQIVFFHSPRNEDTYIIVHRSSFIVHRSSFIVHRSSIIDHRSNLSVPASPVPGIQFTAHPHLTHHTPHTTPLQYKKQKIQEDKKKLCTAKNLTEFHQQLRVLCVVSCCVMCAIVSCVVCRVSGAKCEVWSVNSRRGASFQLSM